MLSNTKTAILIGAGSRGRMAYLHHFQREGVKLVAVADLKPENVRMVKNQYKIADDMCFSDYHDMLKLGKIADIAIICTSDRQHVEPFKMCAELGYHILLEKPVSPFPTEVVEIDKIAETYDKTIMICHVLRYAPFFQKIKEIIDSGAIGKIMSINYSENMAWWFSTTCYVRGVWNNSDTSSPILLAKSCHDMDMLVYLTGKKCKKVSSFGDLSYFKAEKAPEGAGKRCVVDCKVESECPYSAKRIFVEDVPPVIAESRKKDYVEVEEQLIHELVTSNAGKCVFHCDNNVCDHQILMLEFEDNILATFHLNAFNYQHSRTIKICGTLGEIGGNFKTGEICVQRFCENEPQNYVITGKPGESHGGGDAGIVKAFIAAMEGDTSRNITNARETLHSHMICFAAEESRLLGGKVVEIEEFTDRFK